MHKCKRDITYTWNNFITRPKHHKSKSAPQIFSCPKGIIPNCSRRPSSERFDLQLCQVAQSALQQVCPGLVNVVLDFVSELSFRQLACRQWSLGLSIYWKKCSQDLGPGLVAASLNLRFISLSCMTDSSRPAVLTCSEAYMEQSLAACAFDTFLFPTLDLLEAL